jgi:amidase/aspartyl-tRNA(Asn)/glutamyl-tRNA(Gln) amidotransferase subunit A
MTFRDWQQLSPADAAREVHQRVRTRLSPAQQRAVIAQLSTEAELAAAFAEAPRGRPLSGVPYFLKDLFPVAGQPMFAGSTFLPEVRPLATQDAAIVQKLRAAGAVLAGRTHLQEFAYGITGENPHYGDCEHPRFPGHLTGGSSSGSAAVVAAGIVPLALGTDTGGSVRVPAAFCGLFGFRLTPRDPLISDAFPLAPSYDTAGWFTANAGDMAAAIGSLTGLAASLRTPRGCYVELSGLEPDVALACNTAAARIASVDASAGAAVKAALEQSVDTYNTVVADEAWRVHLSWAARFQDRYDPAVWQRLNRVHALTGQQREAARQSTAAIQRMWQDYFRSHDFLVLAASPFPAPTKAECTLENRTRILTLTSPASIGGYPVLTVPLPLPSGLTTGLQIVVPQVNSAAIGWVLDEFTAR